MCWMCDHPGAGPEAYAAHLQAVIARSGWAIQGVEGDGTHPSWAYTVGLTVRRLPELVVTGMDLIQATALLNEAAVLRQQITPGQHLHIAGRCIQVIAVSRPWAHLNMAKNLYGSQIRGLQLVHADSYGYWPWNAHYRSMAGPQPVLGKPGA